MKDFDFYRDTDSRMLHDAEFAQAVHMLMHFAMKHGYTPGELKQIAFRAALEAELMATRSVHVPSSVLRESEALLAQELRRRALDGKGEVRKNG